LLALLLRQDRVDHALDDGRRQLRAVQHLLKVAVVADRRSRTSGQVQVGGLQVEDLDEQVRQVQRLDAGVLFHRRATGRPFRLGRRGGRGNSGGGRWGGGTRRGGRRRSRG